MPHQPSTREAILREAASLFARRGYLGTSTREIARAVGIAQPSLFHHFDSKTAIAMALFDYQRNHLPSFRGHLDLPEASPAVRFYQAVRAEGLAAMSSEYDLRGFYLTEVMDYPEFAEWKKGLEDAKEFLASLVRQGVESGDFVDQDVRLLMRVFDAVYSQTLQWAPMHESELDISEYAAILMRLVLKDTSQIPRIREEADRLMAASVAKD